MDYKKFGDKIYARFDKVEEIISKIMEICKKENILSATFSGIGGCGDVTVSTFIPEKNDFIEHNKAGLLEMVSCHGNIIADENDNIYEHTHAMFSYMDNGEVKSLGGHLKKAVILYTGEFKITPVKNGVIRRMKDPQTGIMVWKF